MPGVYVCVWGGGGGERYGEGKGGGGQGSPPSPRVGPVLSRIQGRHLAGLSDTERRGRAANSGRRQSPLPGERALGGK